jgi:hypothetical protein
MYLSYDINIPSGTTIVLVNAAAFIVVLLVSGARRRAVLVDLHDHDVPVPVAARRA